VGTGVLSACLPRQSRLISPPGLPRLPKHAGAFHELMAVQHTYVCIKSEAAGVNMKHLDAGTSPRLPSRCVCSIWAFPVSQIALKSTQCHRCEIHLFARTVQRLHICTSPEANSSTHSCTPSLKHPAKEEYSPLLSIQKAAQARHTCGIIRSRQLQK